MRTHYLLCSILLLAVSCFGQTPKPSTTKLPVKSKALVACEKQSKFYEDGWADALNGWEATGKELQAEKQKSTELQKKYEDAITVLHVLQSEVSFHPLSDQLKQRLTDVRSGDAMNLATDIETNHGQLVDFARKTLEHDSMAVDKYNALLADYKDYVQRVSIQLAQIGQANRINNALAIYQLMPKYTPPQTINIQFTDCTRLPALCVH